MEESLEQKAEAILKENVKNIELISYFKRSTIKTPIFLGVIQRQYAEIKSILKRSLIKDLDPIKSYIFSIDKFENFFYSKYQEKIDFLKSEIWRRKRKKDDLITMTTELEPEEGAEEFEQKLQVCLEFARETIGDLDKMEVEKEDYNNIIGELQKKMKADPYYKFLLYLRNDKDIIFNKRTEDNDGVIHKKILNYLNHCSKGKGWSLFTEMKKRGFFKEYSPAKNYYISKLGLWVDSKLKTKKWAKDEETYQKNPEEIAQEEEYNKLKELFQF